MEEEFKKLYLDQKWEEHHENLLKRSRKHSADIGDKSSNVFLNRYLNVKPYDRSRVKLSRCAEDTDYINANLVTVPKAARQYILTQGPLPDTLAHFWLMVWEQKSNVIVMLNKMIEVESYSKCEQYWPDKFSRKDEYDYVKLSVTLTSVKNEKHYIVREMVLEDTETNEKRTITQFHYTAWPDHGEPDSPTSLLRLLTAIRKRGGLDKMDEPTIVHCSAGIGRSGTFCLIDSILSMVENQGSTEGIDIDNTLLEMRDYRMGLIQSPVQLRFAYMSIIYGIKILERANKLNPHISSIKDNLTNDSNGSQSKTNGSQQNSQSKSNGNKKINRRNTSKKTRQSHGSSNSLNVFKKHLLVDALDDIDSDEADSLFYDTMKPWPNMKKPRNSSPEEDFNEDQLEQIKDLIKNGSFGLMSNHHDKQHQLPTSTTQTETRAQMLTNAINSLLTEKMISTTTNASSSISTESSTVLAAQSTTDSVLLRRREKELKNQRIAEKTMDIKNRMKAEELKRELHARRKTIIVKSLFGGAVALALSLVVYAYINVGQNSS